MTLVITIPATATASGPARWRVAAKIGPVHGFTTIDSVATAGRKAEWAAGISCPSTDSCKSANLVVERSVGHGWHKVAAPAVPVRETSLALVGASSAANAWLIAGQYPQVKAEQWNGRHWRAFPLAHRIDVTALEVFSPSDAWLFGLHGATGTSYNAHFDGRSWHHFTLPTRVSAVSALSARNIWALGVEPVNFRPILMHWNGAKWATIAGPKIKVPKRDDAFPTRLVALGPKNIWLLYQLGGHSGPPPFALGLVHWNGTAWRQQPLVPFHAFIDDGLASDGHGGLWLSATINRPRSQRLLHYSAGQWTEQPPPGNAKHQTLPVDLTLLPGTRSLLAGGMIGIAGASPVQGVVIDYGP